MEEQIVGYKELIFSSFKSFFDQITSALPNVLGALVLLILGWFMAKLISYIFTKVLKVVKFDELADKIKAGDMLARANIDILPSKLVGKFIYWIVLLLFIVMATDTLGLTIVSQQISELINFIPTIFSGIVIFVIGSFIAGFIRDIIAAATSSLGFSGGSVASGFVFYFLMIIVTLMALDQIGIDTTIITSNVVLIMGAILLSASISYGFASRDVMSNMLAAFFSRKMFEVGQEIRVDDVQGTIIRMDSLAITVDTGADKVVIPSRELIDRKVRILN